MKKSIARDLLQNADELKLGKRTIKFLISLIEPDLSTGERYATQAQPLFSPLRQKSGCEKEVHQMAICTAPTTPVVTKVKGMSVSVRTTVAPVKETTESIKKLVTSVDAE